MQNNESKYLEFAQSILDERDVPEFRLSNSEILTAIANNDLCLVLNPRQLLDAFFSILEKIADDEDYKTLAKKFKIFLDFLLQPEVKSYQAKSLSIIYYTLKSFCAEKDFQDLDRLQKFITNKAITTLKSYILKSNAIFTPKVFDLLCKTDAKLAKLKLDNLAPSKDYTTALQHLDLSTSEGFEIACFLVSNFYIKDYDAIANILPLIVQIGNNDKDRSQTANATLRFGLAYMVDTIVKDDTLITKDYYQTKIFPLTEASVDLKLEVAYAFYDAVSLCQDEHEEFTKLLLQHIGEALSQVHDVKYVLAFVQKLDYIYSPNTDDAIYAIYRNLLLKELKSNRDVITAVEIVGNNYCSNFLAKHRPELLNLIYNLYYDYGETYEFTTIKASLNLRIDELQTENLLTPKVIAFWCDSKNSLLWEETIVRLSNATKCEDLSDNLNVKQAIKIIYQNHKDDDKSFLTKETLERITKIAQSI